MVDATSGLQIADRVAGQKGQVRIRGKERGRILLLNGRDNRRPSAKYAWFSTMRKRVVFAPSKDFRELPVHHRIVAINRA